MCDREDSLTQEQESYIQNNIRLRKLYETCCSIFQQFTINLICELGQKNVYTISNLVNFGPIIDIPIFRQYMDETDVNLLREIESQIDEYLKYLCKYNYCSNLNLVKSRILQILKMSLTIPVSQYFSLIGSVKITYNTTYKPSRNTPITVPTDIANLIDSQFYNMSNNIREEDFTYEPTTSMHLQLHGNVIENTVKGIVQLQEFMQLRNDTLNINVRPFIQVPRYN